LSVIADISFWRFYFRLFRAAIKSPRIAEFLKALQTHSGLKLLIIRERLAGHRSRLVRDFVECQQGVPSRSSTCLPAHAPDLNPVEHISGHVKRREAANFCPAEDCPDLCVIRLYFRPQDSIFNGSMLYRCCQSE
jgi:hypothetical protein